MWHTGFPMGSYAFDKLGCKTAAVGYTDFPPGKDSVEAFRTSYEKAGGKVIESIAMGNPAQVPDFTPFFQRIKDAKPDCMYIFIPSGSHATGVIKTYGELGMRDAGIKLIGPMDLVPDNKLQDMGDAAIGTIIMTHYAVDFDNAANKEFVAAWHKEYGANSYPDFMSAQGWDTMAGIFAAIKKLNGNVKDGMKVVDALKGWSHSGPRGLVKIDPVTRDIIQDEHAAEVYRKPDGKLGIKTVAIIEQVIDQCKAMKVGRCGK
jgi:branched-chain amino acid transport system substrate-binding protein